MKKQFLHTLYYTRDSNKPLNDDYKSSAFEIFSESIHYFRYNNNIFYCLLVLLISKSVVNGKSENMFCLTIIPLCGDHKLGEKLKKSK